MSNILEFIYKEIPGSKGRIDDKISVSANEIGTLIARYHEPLNIEEVKKAIKQYKSEQLQCAETPYHFESEIWKGMNSFLSWLDSNRNH